MTARIVIYLGDGDCRIYEDVEASKVSEGVLSLAYGNTIQVWPLTSIRNYRVELPADTPAVAQVER